MGRAPRLFTSARSRHGELVTVRSYSVTLCVAMSRAWNAVLALVIAAAMITQIVVLVHGEADVNAVTSEASIGLAVRLVRLFSYFTIQSNLLVLALAIS